VEMEATSRIVRQSGHWIEYFDEKQGNTFYFNSKTEQTTWSVPAVFGGEEWKEYDCEILDNEAEAKEVGMKIRKKRKYWFNSITGESSWEAPRGIAPILSSEKPDFIRKIEHMEQSRSEANVRGKQNQRNDLGCLPVRQAETLVFTPPPLPPEKPKSPRSAKRVRREARERLLDEGRKLKCTTENGREVVLLD